MTGHGVYDDTGMAEVVPLRRPRADDPMPRCPVCSSQNVEINRHPSGGLLCRDCPTVFNGSPSEYDAAANAKRRALWAEQTRKAGT